MLERKAHFDIYHALHPPVCSAKNVLYTIKTKHIIRKIIALIHYNIGKLFNEWNDTLLIYLCRAQSSLIFTNNSF